MDIKEYEKLLPVHSTKIGNEKIRFYTPTVFTLWRAKSLFTKEPWTIEWLDMLGKEDRFFDVGANMGIYSIYAGLIRKAKVISVEPEVTNCFLLRRNIELNSLETSVTLMSLGLTDREQIQPLFINDLRIGGSCHSLGSEVDHSLNPKKSKIVEYVYSTTLDRLVQTLATNPTHIKIDVDGLEHLILRGAKTTLQNSELKSLCIELNTNLAEHRDVLSCLNSFGFRCDQSQVSRATRQSGTFSGVAEHIFYR